VHLVIGGNTTYIKNPSATELTSQTTPTGVTAKSARPCFAKYRRKTVINGRYSPGVCWHDDLSSLTKLGITAPAATPTIAAGAGTGITATNIRVYQTFVQESGGVKVHESNPGPISNTLSALTNQDIAYSTLDTTAEARVTHSYLYRSDSGDSVFRFDKKLAIASSSTTSSIPTLSLSATVVLPQTASGAVDVYARGVPPYTVFSKVYHDRGWYAGDPSYPQRIWYSRLGEIESVDNRVGLVDTQVAGGKGDYFDTRDGEAVTGLAVCSDQLVVFTAKSTYVIQGYTDGVSDGIGTADFTMAKVAPSIGCISHFSIVNVGGPSGGDMLFFAAQDGVWAYNGSSFKYMMNDIRSDWRDAYLADSDAYEDSVATFDNYFNVYKLMIPETSTTFYYIAHVLPMTQGGEDQPHWTFDTRARRDSFVGNLANSNNLFESFTGSCDGKIRKENQMLVGDDDGVDKAWDVLHKHYFFGGISGGVNHGNTFTDADAYLKNESTAVTMSFYAGDEYVNESTTPSKSIPIAAGAASGFVARGSTFAKLDKAVGRGISINWTATNPIGVELAGFGISWKPGQNTRKASS
jgi:hypothetical protein